MKLPSFQTEKYDPESTREMVRQIELFMSKQDRINALITASGAVSGLSDEAPQPLGSAAPGTGTSASRGDHVHRMPSASDVGADELGEAEAEIAAHIAEANPHPQYILSSSTATAFPYSITRIDDNVSLTVPQYHNLLITHHGLEIRPGAHLNLLGNLVDVT